MNLKRRGSSLLSVAVHSSSRKHGLWMWDKVQDMVNPEPYIQALDVSTELTCEADKSLECTLGAERGQ